VTAVQAGCHKNCGFIASTDFETSVYKASVPALGPTQCVNGGCFPKKKSGWGMKLTMDPHLVLNVKREGTHTYITLYAFMA